MRPQNRYKMGGNPLSQKTGQKQKKFQQIDLEKLKATHKSNFGKNLFTNLFLNK